MTTIAPRAGLVPHAHERLIWTPLNIGRIEVTVTRVAADGTWTDLVCTLSGRSWSKRQRLPLPPSFTRVMVAGDKPACESCQMATGWGRAIRREPEQPLHCGTCELGGDRRPRLVLVGASR